MHGSASLLPIELFTGHEKNSTRVAISNVNIDLQLYQTNSGQMSCLTKERKIARKMFKRHSGAW